MLATTAGAPARAHASSQLSEDPMNRRFAASLGALALLTLACSSDDPPDDIEGPGAYSHDFETSEEFFTLMQGPVLGASPHGAVQIWYSSNVMESLGSSRVPLGTVAIKTSAPATDGAVEAITVMVKREPGYSPDHGDWMYEMRGADGTVMMDDDQQPMQGPIPMCIDCHVAAAGTDYLAGTHLR
jgi:hypothetical protein